MPVQVTRTDELGNIQDISELSSLNSTVEAGDDLPSYESIDYAAIAPLLELCCDAYEGATGWILNQRITSSEKVANYLPAESQEKPEQYAARVTRSLYKNSFKSAVKGFAGLLSDFVVGDDAVVGDWLENVDLQGSSLTAFLCDADELVLRDGMCGVLVDYPVAPEVENAEQEQALELRPYLVLVERKDILNWRYNNLGQLIRATIRSTETRQKGRFGEEQITVYHVWEPGLKQTWEDRDDGVVLVDEVDVTLPMVPLVPYSITSLHPFRCKPPLLDLALMNFHHYRLYSDYIEVMHKCNLPVPVRKGYMVAGTQDSSALPPVTIGPNTAIDIPVDGDFFFAGPTGTAIADTRQAILDVEESMMQESLNFLGSSGEKTKYEVQLRSSQSRASLGLLAEQKESAVEQIFQVWAAWLGSEDIGGIEVNRDLLQEKLDANMVRILSDMQTLGQIPVDMLLRSLQQGRVLPKTINVDEVLQRTVPQDEAIGL